MRLALYRPHWPIFLAICKRSHSLAVSVRIPSLIDDTYTLLQDALELLGFDVDVSRQAQAALWTCNRLTGDHSCRLALKQSLSFGIASVSEGKDWQTCNATEPVSEDLSLIQSITQAG